MLNRRPGRHGVAKGAHMSSNSLSRKNSFVKIFLPYHSRIRRAWRCQGAQRSDARRKTRLRPCKLCHIAGIPAGMALPGGAHLGSSDPYGVPTSPYPVAMPGAEDIQNALDSICDHSIAN